MTTVFSYDLMKSNFTFEKNKFAETEHGKSNNDEYDANLG